MTKIAETIEIFEAARQPLFTVPADVIGDRVLDRSSD